MTCFDRAGVKVPKCADGVARRCKCGEMVRFDIPTRRVEHFMVCPVVDAKLAKAQVDVRLDAEILAAGRVLAERLGL